MSTITSAQQEVKAKRDAAILLLTAAYDQWSEDEDAVFEKGLNDRAEEKALEKVRDKFADTCAKVFVL